jgi:hypothetical protein
VVTAAADLGIALTALFALVRCQNGPLDTRALRVARALTGSLASCCVVELLGELGVPIPLTVGVVRLSILGFGFAALLAFLFWLRTLATRLALAAPAGAVPRLWVVGGASLLLLVVRHLALPEYGSTSGLIVLSLSALFLSLVFLAGYLGLLGDLMDALRRRLKTTSVFD